MHTIVLPWWYHLPKYSNTVVNTSVLSMVHVQNMAIYGVMQVIYSRIWRLQNWCDLKVNQLLLRITLAILRSDKTNI